MKDIKAYCAALAVLLCAAEAQAQATRRVTAENYNDYGLVYELPSTALNITLKAEHTVYTAGPFARYSRKYTGTDASVKENLQTWDLISAKAVPYGIVTQESEAYRIQLTPNSTAYLSTTADGMLLTINSEPAEPYKPALPDNRFTRTGLPELTGEEYLSYVSEDFLSATSSAMKARMLSESLAEVKDSRLGLTRGTSDITPSDGRQLDLMLSSLAEQENALTAAFNGSVRKEEGEISVSFVPDKEGRYVIARLSDEKGFTDPSDLSGEPVYLTVKVTRKGEIPEDAKGNPKELPKDAVAYCIPGAAEITVECGGREFLRMETEFAQYGSVFGLSPQIFTDKKDPKYAVFSPVTGNVVEIGSARSLE